MGNCRRAVRVPCTSSGFRQLPRNRRENTLGLHTIPLLRPAGSAPSRCQSHGSRVYMYSRWIRYENCTYTLLYCAVNTPAYPGLYSHSTVLTLRHCTVQPHDRTEVHLYGTVLYSTAVASATGYYSRSTGTRTAYM